MRPVGSESISSAEFDMETREDSFFMNTFLFESKKLPINNAKLKINLLRKQKLCFKCLGLHKLKFPFKKC